MYVFTIHLETHAPEKIKLKKDNTMARLLESYQLKSFAAIAPVFRANPYEN
jgi:hypothetical protein